MAQVDLFGSRETEDCEMWFPLRPHDLLLLGVDAMAYAPCPQPLLYVFLPQQQIHRFLEWVRQESQLLILLVPENQLVRRQGHPS